MPLRFVVLASLQIGIGEFAAQFVRVGISSADFVKLQQRAAGARPPSTPQGRAEVAATDNLPVVRVVLGVDPSLRGTGWGVIRGGPPHPVVLAQGTIACSVRWERSRCLAFIAQTLTEVLRGYPSELCAVEGLFHARNLRTALIMGEARGAALSAVAAAGMPVYEIAPRRVKLAVVGFGGAQKLAVAKMVQRLTQLVDLPAPDAADALALALTYLQEAGRFSRLGRGIMRV